MRIERTVLTIPTYSWEKADIEPPFIREFTPRNQPIYPYSTQENVDREKLLRDYEAIVFENEYLRITFLPELNGRIYSAFDKINRREMFYANPVIKPCLFGLRGAWAAVGVEYNFPNSHSTTTLDRIPHQIVEHENGAASFICGNVERVSGMGWSVEVILEPNVAAIKMISMLQNLSEFPQRYYYWMNAAVPIYQESRYIYPPSTHRLYTHPPMDISSLGYINYPIHNGVDVSLYKNVTRHFPVFAETMKEDFFGIYHHDYDYGLVHIADHSLVRGRKLWMFGNAHDGKIWMDKLTENGVNYCELQTGPFSLQSDYRMLQPGQVHVQEDRWFPVGKMGGFNAVSVDMALNVTLNDYRSCCLQLNATRQFENAKLVIRTKSRTMVTQYLDLVKPMEIQNIELILPQEVTCDELNIVIFDNTGREIVKYVNDSMHSETLHDFPTEIVSELNNARLKARYLEQQGYPDDVIAFYSVDAAKNLESKIAVGRLLACRGLWSDAVKILNEALRIECSNAEGHYYAGLCNRKLGNYGLAEEHFSRAIDDAYWATNAKMQLTMISISQKEYLTAVRRLEQLQEYHGLTSRILALYAVALRKVDRSESAEKMLKNANKLFQFDPLVLGEQFLCDKKHIALTNIANCHEDEDVLNILSCYLDIKQFDDAEAIILFYLYACDGNAINPLLYYYLGYIQGQLGKIKESLCSYETARNMTGMWDGAAGLETETILRTALEVNPHDSTALFQLGNLLASLGRWNEAVELWPKVTGQYRCLAMRAMGLYWWKMQKTPQKAIPHFNEACTSKNCGAKTIWEYDHLLEDMGMYDARLTVLEQHGTTVSSDNRLLLRHASALIGAARFQDGLDILMNHDFALCEGKILPRILFETACSRLAEERFLAKDLCGALTFYQKLLEYPENLGVGKPAFNSEAKWWWYCGKILKIQGEAKKAMQYFENGSCEGDGNPIDFFPLQHVVIQHGPATIETGYWINEFFKAICYRESGNVGEFERHFMEIQKFLDSVLLAGRGEELSVKLIKMHLDKIKETNLAEMPFSIFF